jgi:transposase
MNETQLYQQLLGLTEEWGIADVKIDFEKLEVHILIEHKNKKRGKCPECGNNYNIYDIRDERNWRHLDTMQFKTILHCKIPRVNCPEHGIKTVKTDWAEKYSRYTAMFEKWAIQLLIACKNHTQAEKLLGLSWDEIQKIQEKAVKRGLSRRTVIDTEYLGVDEKSFQKGHTYATVLYDLESKSVLDVSKDRKEESLDKLLSPLSDKTKESIKAVAVDMWEPFKTSIEKNLPFAKIVYDKFHIVKHLSEAVDKVRKQENRLLIQQEIEDLKKTKYIWLKNQQNWTEKQAERFKELIQKGLKVGIAWTLKEFFKMFWNLRDIKIAYLFLKIWNKEVLESKLEPMIKFAEMIKGHLTGILNYIEFNITNAVAEGINSKIQYLFYAARGFRNFENFRTAILFYCGNLDMFPQNSR